MYILGIESSCDETAAAIVEDGKHLISNVISTSVKEQALYGGVVPEIASRRHAEYISATVQQALQDANMTIADVDAVAVTFAPGLIGAVLVGGQLCQGPGLRRGQAAGAGTSSARAHCSQLSDPPTAGAAIPLPGGQRRPQPYCAGRGLVQVPCSGPHG